MPVRRPVIAVVATVFMALAAGASPAAAEPDYVLDAAGLEQTVLRAQMPKTLGSWRQNLYGTLTSSAPQVCWSTTGTPVSLTKAPTAGLVGYEVNSNITGAVMIYQYSDEASADKALARLQATVCPDDAEVGLDSGPGNTVDASQGSDITSSARDGIEASVTYKEGSVTVTTTTITTQRGLAVVQTEVTVSGSARTSKSVQKAADMNRTWHQRVLSAYEAFGSGGSR